MRLLSPESISQITFASTFSSKRVRLESGSEVLVQTLLYKRKKRSSAPSPSFAIEHQFPSPQIFLWSLCGGRAVICSCGNRKWGWSQASGAQGLDVPQMGTLRSSMEFPRGDSQTGKKPSSLSLPLWPLLIFIPCSQSPIPVPMPTVYSPVSQIKKGPFSLWGVFGSSDVTV